VVWEATVGDFDDLLERLLLEPHFKAALAADPASTLAGYDLDADERALLMSHVAADAGLSGRVEERVSKAGMAGLFSAFHEGVHEGLGERQGLPSADSKVHLGDLKQHLGDHKQHLGEHKAIALGDHKTPAADGSGKLPPADGSGKVPPTDGMKTPVDGAGSKMPPPDDGQKTPAS
jgi:hypothetical protein